MPNYGAEFERHTLSAPTGSTFRLSFISSIRANFIELQGRPKCSWLKDERLSQRLCIFCPRLPLTLPVIVALVPLEFLLVIVVSQALLEECGDRIGYTLQFFVAFLLGCLQTSVDMPPHEGHRHSVRTGRMSAAGGRLRLQRDCWEYGLRREYEWTWRLTTRETRVGHVAPRCAART